MKSVQRLLHLTALSVDLDAIKCINWDAPIGVTIYIGQDDRKDYNTVCLRKADPDYEADCESLQKAVGK